MAKRLTTEQTAAFKAGYNDRYDGKPNRPPFTPAKRLYNLYCSGYVQACNDIVIFKRDRADGLRRALGDMA